MKTRWRGCMHNTENEHRRHKNVYPGYKSLPARYWHGDRRQRKLESGGLTITEGRGRSRVRYRTAVFVLEANVSRYVIQRRETKKKRWFAVSNEMYKRDQKSANSLRSPCFSRQAILTRAFPFLLCLFAPACSAFFLSFFALFEFVSRSLFFFI